ncbi:hypothetical protein AKJ52_00300 [candidate division MSBL1 archaeon SCGC-AAA382C18]|uniref:Cation:proton antiporter n=1 Tax=candidate division MSBL1 archaeon SCGC-AAA382C18 TaxID=1698281 RepID=A0A133VLZ1_9EURY|nr:hypothetical protein AKJ52_00300 [candidate division MSBL1 archaeon SCGC-AAA382C18]
MSIILLITVILLCIGSFFTFVGSIGIVRMPDVYNRIHSETLCVVGGSILVFIAIAIYGITLSELSSIPFGIKALLIAGFLFVTNPVGSHAIARAAHKSRARLYSETKVDELEEFEK